MATLDEVTGFGNLPDKVSVLILSHMTLVEAARTSVLSQYWCDLWIRVPSFNFDASTVLPENKVDQYEKWYVEWVKNVLELRTSLDELISTEDFPVKEFGVHYWLGKNYIDDIKYMISFAYKERVETISINLTGYMPDISDRQLHQFCKLSEQDCFDVLSTLATFDFLRALDLKCVKLSKELIESILEGCRHLESFFITFGGNFADLNCSSLGLRHLAINGSSGNVLTMLYAPELLTFVYTGEVFEPEEVHLPKLVKLRIWAAVPFQIFEKLKVKTARLQDLGLLVNKVNILDLEQIPDFQDLKFLSLRVDSYRDCCCGKFILLLKACPSLQRLQICFSTGCHIPDDPDEVLPQSVDICCPKCLKEIELVVFDGEVFDFELVKCVIGNSPQLEKVFINTRFLVESHGGGIETEAVSEIVKSVKMRAVELRGNLPIGTELIFPSYFPTGAECVFN